MAGHDRSVDELLDFLLTRLDETRFPQLVAHEPKRMVASYNGGPYWAGSRSGPQPAWFTGCVTCSPFPSRVVADPVTGAECVLWRAIDVKAYREATAPYEERHGRSHQLEIWGDQLDIDVEAWPCAQVRSLALPFADDPDYRHEWRPQYAVFASGKLVHPDGERPWPRRLPPPATHHR